MAVIVCAPHPDDEMIGMGGTIAKFSEEGEEVIVVIFTLGEGSHPWQRREAINETRRKEALNAGKIAGSAETIFLELKDLSIAKEVVENNVSERFLDIIKAKNPELIFIPAIDDLHNDHRAVAKFVLAVHDENKLAIPTYMYTVWNPLHIINRDKPKMVINITKTFRKKWLAIQAYESQKVSTFQLIPTVMLRGLFHGLRHGYHMAEVFMKIR